MRLLGIAAAVVTGAVYLASLLGGIALAGYGALNLWDDYRTYHVGFDEAGTDCGSMKVQLDVNSGEPLYCMVGRLPGNDWTPSFHGFTGKQNSDVLSLARQLADGGGLSDADQDKIQDLVDTYAATVPADQRPQHRFLGSRGNLIAGLGALSLGLLMVFVANRRAPAPPATDPVN